MVLRELTEILSVEGGESRLGRPPPLKGYGIGRISRTGNEEWLYHLKRVVPRRFFAPLSNLLGGAF